MKQAAPFSLDPAVFRTIGNPWMLAAVCVVGTVIAPVLVGFAPLGGDPELMYQPIKAELGRSLAAGRLPFWSDRFGLGVPLVAESHVAAFYPPNWLFYRLWDVETAYGLTMWAHWVALAAATFAYARSLGISQAGSALAALGFALCGFQAVHASPRAVLSPDALPAALPDPGRPVRGDRPAGLAGWPGAGLGRPDHARTFPDPDVDRRARAGGWCVAVLGPSESREDRVPREPDGPRTRRSRRAAGAVANPRPDPGPGLGPGDRLGATAR